MTDNIIKKIKDKKLNSNAKKPKFKVQKMVLIILTSMLELLEIFF